MEERREQPTDDFDEAPSIAPEQVVCAACGHRLTSRASAIAVDGRHDHRCANPAGIVFDIRCYGEAPGEAAVGEPDTWFSWFRGTAWQIALCAGCRVHVGWRFTGTPSAAGSSGRKSAFFALIDGRVREL